MSDMDKDNWEREKYHWGWFVIYCKGEGINMDHEDDWGPFWDIWKTAIDREIESREK